MNASVHPEVLKSAQVGRRSRIPSIRDCFEQWLRNNAPSYSTAYGDDGEYLDGKVQTQWLAFAAGWASYRMIGQ
jgi:Cdc6-like AAA superfamily ATPase